METTQTETTIAHRWEVFGYKAPYKLVRSFEKTYQACPGAPIQAGTTCDVCGTGIKNVYVIRDARGVEFQVGCDCVWHLHDEALTAEVEQARRERAAEIRAERARARREAGELTRAERTRQACAAFLARAENEGLEAALETDHPIVHDIAERFRQFGSVSPAQAALVFKLASEARRPAHEERKVAAPVGAGRVTFRGRVVKTKLVESLAYGNTLKMLVKVMTEDGGTWLAWGTIPSKLLATLGETEYADALVGAEVEVLLGAALEARLDLAPSCRARLRSGSASHLHSARASPGCRLSLQG